MPELFQPITISILAFLAVAAGVFVGAQMLATQIRVQNRIGGASNQDASFKLGAGLDALIAGYFDEKHFGLEGSVRARLRAQLVRAGFFRPDAINYYIFGRVAVVIIGPAIAYIGTSLFLADQHWLLKLGLLVVAIFTCVMGPDAYLARRERKLQDGYRIAFPDMLDLLVVCVDSGLSLEAAMDRISTEIMRQNRALGINLQLLSAERRAGRGTPDALDAFAQRVGLDEARALAGLLRQSIELGTDVADALRVFGDEMRDRRMLRAEERANQLPVKMVGPLGLCIFPVILMLVMVPMAIRLASVLK
jgi:tight adherence protein C